MNKEDFIDYDPGTGRMKTPPRQIYLELTSRCNLDCVTCSVDYGKSEGNHLGDMPLETVDRLAPWLQDAMSVNLNVVGEPLIHPFLFDVLDRLDSQVPKVHFNTNGVALTESVCERLVAGSVHSLAISVDGSHANRAIRGIPYDALRKRVSKLVQTRDKSSSPYPYIGIAYTLMRRNLSELTEVMKDLFEIGVDFFHVQPLIIFYESLASENIYDAPETNAVLREARDLGEKFSKHVTVFRSNFQEDERNDSQEELQVGGFSKRYGCVDPFYEIKVRFDGRVLSCSYGLDGGFNVNEIELDDLWNNSWYTALRKRLYEGRFEQRCAGCPYIFGSRESQLSAQRPGVKHSRESRFFEGSGVDRSL